MVCLRALCGTSWESMTDSNAHGAHSLATGPLHIHFDRIAILLDSDIALVPLLEQIGQCPPPPPPHTHCFSRRFDDCRNYPVLLSSFIIYFLYIWSVMKVWIVFKPTTHWCLSSNILLRPGSVSPTAIAVVDEWKTVMHRCHGNNLGGQSMVWQALDYK